MKSIWNGTLGFGLVNIPIKMYSATESRTIDLDMLDSKDHARIRYQRINEKSGKEVDWKDIVKGYKMDDKYVILEDEDFEQAAAKKSKVVEIEAFIDDTEVPDMLFKKPYYLEPQKDGGKAYNLLRDALKKTKKLGLATFVMRQKEN
jgi:DNA end-binding protein Ku